MTRKISDPTPDKPGLGLSQLLVEVEFGVPSRQCINYGICRIDLASGRSRPHSSGCSRCGGLALASAPEKDVLELAFLHFSLDEQTRQKHFGNGCFRVEEAYPLPRFLYRKLGLPAAAIGTGRYGVTEAPPFLIIRFSNLIIF